MTDIVEETSKRIGRGLTFPAELILRAYGKGRFEAFIVWGEQRVGKSAYAIKTARDVYMALNGCDEKTAYKMALDCIKFDKKDVFMTIREHMVSNEVMPILIWDDTGVHGSSYQFFINSREVAALKGVFDTVGTGLSGLIMTTPSPEGILKFIRDYHFYEIEISRICSEWDRKAQPREYYHSRRGWSLRRTKEHDLFSCYLPPAVWKEYIARRKAVAVKAIDEVLEVVDGKWVGSPGSETRTQHAQELKQMKEYLEKIDENVGEVVG